MNQEQKDLKIKELKLKINELKACQSETRGIKDILYYQVQIDGIKDEIEELEKSILKL